MLQSLSYIVLFSPNLRIAYSVEVARAKLGLRFIGLLPPKIVTIVKLPKYIEPGVCRGDAGEPDPR